MIAGRDVTVTQAESPADDTNSNGLPDAWELANLGNLTQGAGDDPDGDGFPNYVEWRYGTNPKSFSNRPDATLSVYRAVELRFNAVTGVVYDIEGSDDLLAWSKVGSPVVGDGRPFKFLSVHRVFQHVLPPPSANPLTDRSKNTPGWGTRPSNR